jgi:hypothetical protein
MTLSDVVFGKSEDSIFSSGRQSGQPSSLHKSVEKHPGRTLYKEYVGKWHHTILF